MRARLHVPLGVCAALLTLASTTAAVVRASVVARPVSLTAVRTVNERPLPPPAPDTEVPPPPAIASTGVVVPVEPLEPPPPAPPDPRLLKHPTPLPPTFAAVTGPSKYPVHSDRWDWWGPRIRGCESWGDP